MKQAVRHGQPIPNKILNAPELTLGLHLFIDAFWELNSERSIGMGLGPIPLTSVLAYASEYDFDDDQRSDLVFFIRSLDAAFLKRMDEKKPK